MVDEPAMIELILEDKPVKAIPPRVRQPCYRARSVACAQGQRLAAVWRVGAAQWVSASLATASMGYLVTFPMTATPTPRVG